MQRHDQGRVSWHGQSEGDCCMEARFLFVDAHYIAAPEEDEVIGVEGTIAENGVGGVNEGDGEVTMIDRSPVGGGVVGDG